MRISIYTILNASMESRTREIAQGQRHSALAGELVGRTGVLFGSGWDEVPRYLESHGLNFVWCTQYEMMLLVPHSEYV